MIAEKFIYKSNCCSLLYKLKLKTVNFKRIKEFTTSDYPISTYVQFHIIKKKFEHQNYRRYIRYPDSIGSSNGNKRTRHGLAKTR